MTKRVSHILKYILIFLTFSSFSGCGGSENESDVGQMEVKFGEATRYIIPSTALSCLQRRRGETTAGLQSKYVELPPLAINWTSKTHYLQIIGIFIKFKSGKLSGGEYNCEFVDQELLALIPKWYINQQARLNPGAATTDEFPAQVSTSDSGGCNIKCGGIDVPNGNFTLLGQVKILAVATDSEDGTEVPLSSQETVTVRSIRL